MVTAVVTPLVPEYRTSPSRFSPYSCLFWGTYSATFRLVFGFHHLLHQLCLTGFEHVSSSLEQCYVTQQLPQNENAANFNRRKKVYERKSKGDLHTIHMQRKASFNPQLSYFWCFPRVCSSNTVVCPPGVLVKLSMSASTQVTTLGHLLERDQLFPFHLVFCKQ